MGRLSDDVIEKANSVNILDVATTLGLDLKRDGKSHHIDGHGGLYINEDGTKWNCFSESKGGGSIQFYMFITGKSWRESVVELSGYNESQNDIMQIAKNKADEYEAKNKRSIFITPVDALPAEYINECDITDYNDFISYDMKLKYEIDDIGYESHGCDISVEVTDEDINEFLSNEYADEFKKVTANENNISLGDFISDKFCEKDTVDKFSKYVIEKYNNNIKDKIKSELSRDYIAGKAINYNSVEIEVYEEETAKDLGRYYKSFDEIIEKRCKMILPEKAEKYSRLYAYLINTRKIDKDVINYFVKEKMLYQEKEHGNAVFVGYDKDKVPKYAAMRGTNTYKTFKGDLENSDKSYGFSKAGISRKIIVFESPIDLMSYMTLQKIIGNDDAHHHLLSLGGTAHVALDRYLKENDSIDTIRLCLDNDNAGYKGTKSIAEAYKDYKIEYEIYSAKDFNEYLQKRIDNGIEKNLANTNETYNEVIANEREDFMEMETQ